jgi:hypothetical protein
MAESADGHEAWTDLDAEDLGAIEQAMAGLRETSPGENSEFVPQFPDLESWVNGFFVITFARPRSQIRWCPKWWDHPEAVLRLDAMWRAWEAAALDPVRGMPAWIRDDLDPNLRTLFSPAGPFADCGDNQHVRPPELPVSATPPKWWSASNWWNVLTDPDQ